MWPKQSGHPHRSLGRDLRCHHRKLTVLPCSPALHRLGPIHSYQPSIQLVSCNVALATYFSTVLMLMP